MAYENKDCINKQSEVSEDVYSDEMLENMKLSTSINNNIDMLNKVIGCNVDLVTRNFSLGRIDSRTAAIFYFDNLVDSKHVDINIMQPLLTDVYASALNSGYDIVHELCLGNIITRAQLKSSDNLKELVNGLLIGEVALLIDGNSEAYIISAKGRDYRKITESEVEPLVRGPRDSFIEMLSVNIGLIRKRIHSPNLIFEALKVGRVTGTTVCISYIKGICSSKLVEEVRSRINKIDIDGVLGSSYIEEFINDDSFSVFPQVRNTERPDVASAALLEGRIVIIVDNTPVVLIAPGELISLTQAAEDYYNRYIFSSIVRLLRFIALVVALTLPSFYIAIVNFHQELIPTKLLMSIIAARSGVPLPNFLEAFLMEGTFEVLREAGVRLPRPVGQAVSIVGALVIGQAAVQASIVSPLMVIVVAITGIATFTIPQYNISLSIRILRFSLMILSSILGFYGLMLGLLFILIHLCSIRSFGVPYLSPVAPYKASDQKDVFIRLPFWTFIKRPTETTNNKNRISSFNIPKPPKNGGDKL